MVLQASERGAHVNIVEFRQRLAASSRDDVDAIVQQFRQQANQRQSLADLATLGLAYDGVVRLRAAVGVLMLLVRQLEDSDLEVSQVSTLRPAYAPGITSFSRCWPLGRSR
jgi:hypothetical protein